MASIPSVVIRKNIAHQIIDHISFHTGVDYGGDRRLASVLRNPGVVACCSRRVKNCD